MVCPLHKIIGYLAFVWCIFPSEPSTYTLQPIPQQSTVLKTTEACSNLPNLLESLALNLTNLISQQVSLNLTCILNTGSSPLCPASSCHSIAEALPSNPSGYYWIQPNSTNASIQVYCDLTKYLCGSRGWMRVAYLNMSDSRQSCPPNWANVTAGTYRLCGRSGNNTCFGVNFTTYSVPYYKVCGWVAGYQYSSNDGFKRYGSSCGNPCTIEGPYVDGVSITHGQNPRQHLWSYAAGQLTGSYCPCYNESRSTYANTVPSFVGSNWYCGAQSASGTYYNYPLWLPGTCPGLLSACCSNSTLPWFFTTLSKNFTDSLEVRLCADELLANEDIRLRNLELYVS